MVTWPMTKAPATAAKVSPAVNSAWGSIRLPVRAMSTLAPRLVRRLWVEAIISVPRRMGESRLSNRVKAQVTAWLRASSRQSLTMTRGEAAVSRSKSSKYRAKAR